MKKYQKQFMTGMVLFLVLSMLLSGCFIGKPPAASTAATFAATSVPATEPVTVPQPEPSLMDGRLPFGTTGNAWLLSVEGLDGLSLPNICLFDGDLLVSSVLWHHNGGNQFAVRRISLETGHLMAEALFDCADYVSVQTFDDHVCLCDSISGLVRILDRSLNEIAVYSFAEDRAHDAISQSDFVLAGDLVSLYRFEQTGIACINLETGAETQVLSGIRDLYIRNIQANTVVFAYTDSITLLGRSRMLDLTTGIFSDLPVSGGIYTAEHAGDIWLIGNESRNYGVYELYTGDTCRLADLNGLRLSLLAPQAHLLTTDDWSTDFSLYDIDGHFLSRFTLDANDLNTVASQTEIWSDRWQGYFFFQYQYDSDAVLAFWDPEIPVAGSDLPLHAVAKEDDPALSPFERAKRLGERFGVTIRIIGQEIDYPPHFYAFEASDRMFLTRALDTLASSLEMYPAGFFQQLLFGSIESIEIELVSRLSTKPGAPTVEVAAAFAEKQLHRYLIVFDIDVIDPDTVYHEFTHVIDQRLAWDASVRPEALFSEEAWMALNPEGFYYAETYSGLPDSLSKYNFTGAFASDYAMTFPTEDRATMMAMAMASDSMQQPHWTPLRKKLAFYSQCIRDCFDTSGWPAVTVWEAQVQ